MLSKIFFFGQPHQVYEFQDEKGFRSAGDVLSQKKEFLEKEFEAMKREDITDKMIAKDKRREKKLKKKANLKEELVDENIIDEFDDNESIERSNIDDSSIIEESNQNHCHFSNVGKKVVKTSR